MSTPNSPLNGQGHELDLVTLPGGTAMLKLGVGTQSVTSSTTDAAWQGVATHEGGAAVGASDGLVVAGAVDGDGNAAALLVDASGNLKVTSSDSIAQDGSDRMIVVGAAADGSAVTGNPVLVAGQDGTNAQSLLTDTSGRLILANAPQNVTVLASAARTTTQTQSDQTNYGHRGVLVVLDATSAGSGSVTLSIQGKDAVSGKYVALLTGAAVTSNSTNVYRVYPGLTAATNLVASDCLPATWRVVVTHDNANTITYSVGAVLLP